MSIGPFISDVEACRAYAAFVNREEPPTNFLSALHPSVSLVTKSRTAEGNLAVQNHLTERQHCDEPNSPLTHVTVLAESKNKEGMTTPVCCSLSINEPTRITSETYISLEDGWVKHIFIYSVWLDPHFPFPERVHEIVARLRLRGVSLASRFESRSNA